MDADTLWLAVLVGSIDIEADKLGVCAATGMVNREIHPSRNANIMFLS